MSGFLFGEPLGLSFELFLENYYIILQARDKYNTLEIIYDKIISNTTNFNLFWSNMNLNKTF